jgi:DNA topoisomerase 2-associated protein PAT1
MAFFGLEQNDLLEREKQRFLQQGRQGGSGGGEDLAVYTWGEESYDGLGDALLEGGDDFNDETFGGSGPVGMCTFRHFCVLWSVHNVHMQARTLIS